jgi:hypothetical protein
MPITPQDVENAVENEISSISESELIACIRRHQVPVRCEQREWDCGVPGLACPCWIFAEHAASNAAFAYCEDGFGPSAPWGLLFIHGKHMSIGMDCGWFTRLEEAFRDSMAWDGVDLPDQEESNAACGLVHADVVLKRG